jgi:hypothetical protein
MIQSRFIAFLTALLCASTVSASHLTFSIGVRETGVDVAIGANGGFVGGIEFVDLDAYDIELDGTWQQVSINLADENLTAFAGDTANGMWDAPGPNSNKGTLELIRIRNEDGITTPITLYLDDLVYTDASGAPTTLGWEGLTVGDEVIFQEPGFSGSTSGNLVDAGTAGVTEDAAFTGTQSYGASFQFVDNTPTRWVRLTTFNTPNVPNPTIELDGVLSFWVNGTTIPEPATATMICLAALGLITARRRS